LRIILLTIFATAVSNALRVDTPIDEGGFNENFGVVEMEFGT